MRLPRRALAAPLILNEQRWLPELGARITAAAGVAVPAPLYAGAPEVHRGYPWAWSVVPWIDGRPGLDVPRTDRGGWAEPLARALRALHRPAPADAPVNPYRGRPLAARDDTVRARLDVLRPAVGEASVTVLQQAWTAGLDAAPWTDAALWIHGDLHPGNVIADGGRLRGIIDFGDVTSGDPAYDLAFAWLGFDEAGRRAFVAELRDLYDPATWTRARGWAAATATIFLAHSDDNPAYAALGAQCLAALE